jgi:hypothetical protein
MSVAMETGAHGLAVGTPDLKSVGPLAFGPHGILFVADNLQATIFAIDVGDTAVEGEAQPIDVEQLDTRLAAYLGCSREDVFIRDMAVHPRSHRAYLSVMRGSGDAAIPVLVSLGADGVLTDVELDGIPFAQTAIPDAPAAEDERMDSRVVLGSREGEDKQMPSGKVLRIARDRLRTVAVTDMAYVDGTLLVAGASNEEFSSTLRQVPFPFGTDVLSNSLEIFHVSHGRYETAAPIRTFMPYAENMSVLASYTCTPVVHFPLEDAQPGAQLKGRTVAELGSGSTPIDIVSFERDGEEYLLVSNSRHPLIKIAARNIDQQEPLTVPKGPVGVPRENLPHPGVSRMAKLGDAFVVMLQQDEVENFHLHSYPSDSL